MPCTPLGAECSSRTQATPPGCYCGQRGRGREGEARRSLGLSGWIPERQREGGTPCERKPPAPGACSVVPAYSTYINSKIKVLRISGQQVQSVKPQDPVQLHLSHALAPEVSCSALLRCEHPSMETRDVILSRAVIQKLVECMSLSQGMGKKLDNEEGNCSLYKCSSRFHSVAPLLMYAMVPLDFTL